MLSRSRGVAIVRSPDSQRTVFFDLQHDNQWHDYQAKLPVRGRITGLRLDPGSAPGRIEIQWIRLEKEDGTLLREWKF